MSKAILHAERSQQLALAKVLGSAPGVMSTMARTRHGHAADCLISQILGDDENKNTTEVSVAESSLPCGLEYLLITSTQRTWRDTHNSARHHVPYCLMLSAFYRIVTDSVLNYSDFQERICASE